MTYCSYRGYWVGDFGLRPGISLLRSWDWGFGPVGLGFRPGEPGLGLGDFGIVFSNYFQLGGLGSYIPV